MDQADWISILKKESKKEIVQSTCHRVWDLLWNIAKRLSCYSVNKYCRKFWENPERTRATNVVAGPQKLLRFNPTQACGWIFRTVVRSTKHQQFNHRLLKLSGGSNIKNLYVRVSQYSNGYHNRLYSFGSTVRFSYEHACQGCREGVLKTSVRFRRPAAAYKSTHGWPYSQNELGSRWKVAR